MAAAEEIQLLILEFLTFESAAVEINIPSHFRFFDF